MKFDNPIMPLRLAAGLFLVATLALQADPTLHIDAGQVTAHVSPTLYGLMTEEINHSYDGGLYAELIQNRAFLDDENAPVHWSLIGGGSGASMALDPSQPLNDVLKISLKLDATGASTSSPVGIANDGFWGIPVRPDTTYTVSFYAKGGGSFSGPLTVSLQSNDGAQTFATAQVSGLTGDWKPYTAILKTAGGVTPSATNRFVISTASPGTVWFDLVSLFPPTWKDRPNGLRPDLMQMLVDLKPAFLRFPGGNFLEGDTIDTRFDWKKTLGPLSQRAGHPGPWGYRSTDGMGLLEFLLWTEEMGAEPVLAVYGGYSLKGGFVKPGSDLDPYVQDALDEIEYVTGDASTTWGARRIADGHPEPFPLHYVEIGNEDFFDKSRTYDGRFAQFYDAIKAKYPDLKCISTIGNEQPARLRVKSCQPDLVDEHYYRSSNFFQKDSTTHFDKYDRQGPGIFVGEWAAFENIEPWKKESSGLPATPSMKAALGDAAWMTAMERNSDIVALNCYAPLLVNVNPGGRQWRPNLIGYDALRSYGSPSYYALKMFSRNHGDLVVQATLDGLPPGPAPALDVVVTKDDKSGWLYLKVVNVTADPQPTAISIDGSDNLAATGKAITLSGQPDETNSLDDPTRVVPVESDVPGIGPTFSYTFPPYSITVLHLSAR